MDVITKCNYITDVSKRATQKYISLWCQAINDQNIRMSRCCILTWPHFAEVEVMRGCACGSIIAGWLSVVSSTRHIVTQFRVRQYIYGNCLVWRISHGCNNIGFDSSASSTPPSCIYSANRGLGSKCIQHANDFCCKHLYSPIWRNTAIEIALIESMTCYPCEKNRQGENKYENTKILYKTKCSKLCEDVESSWGMSSTL